MIVEHSKQSIKRFIKLFLGLEDTPYFFHQTLTFKEIISDELYAKSVLKKLLDSLGQSYPGMTTIFVQEFQERLGIHYHLIFMFFGEQKNSPEIMRELFGREVFRRWNELNGNSLVRQANRMTLQKKTSRTLDYLLKDVRSSTKKVQREILWHGIRNRKLVKEHSIAVLGQLVKQTYSDLYPKRPKTQPPLPPGFTEDEMKGLRMIVEARGKWDWETFKKGELKVNRRVSDRELMEFMNKERNDFLSKRYPSKKTKMPF